MSAENYYQPHVTLNGVRLAESAPARSLAAAARLNIEWGTSDWFQNVEPARLTLTLLDPLGELLRTPKHAPILITRDPDDTPVFRGSVAEVHSTYDRANDPTTGRPRDMWIHEVIAYDPLDALARDRRRGPTYPARDSSAANLRRLHWGPHTYDERLAEVTNRCPIPITWPNSGAGTTVLNYTYAGQDQWSMSAHETQSAVSLLTILRNTFRADTPYSRPVYDPATDAIVPIIPAFQGYIAPDRPTLKNGLTGPGIELVSEMSTTSTQLLDAAEWVASSGIGLSSTATNEVTRVELGTRLVRRVAGDAASIVEQPWEVQFAVRAGAQTTVQLETDAAPPGSAAAATLEPRYNDLTAGMRPLFGLAKLEPIAYRFAEHEPAPAWALPFLTPAPPRVSGSPIVYTLINAPLNWSPTVAPFCALGGTLNYTAGRGWEATITPAAVPPVGEEFHGGETTPAWIPPTLADVTDPRRIDSEHQGSILADWQHLTIAQ